MSKYKSIGYITKFKKEKIEEETKRKRKEKKNVEKK